MLEGAIFGERDVAGQVGAAGVSLKHGIWLSLHHQSHEWESTTESEFSASSTEESWIIYSFFIVVWRVGPGQQPSCSQWDGEEMRRMKAAEMKTGWI